MLSEGNMHSGDCGGQLECVLGTLSTGITGEMRHTTMRPGHNVRCFWNGQKYSLSV